MFNSPYSILGFIVLVFDVIAVISVIGGSSSTERKALWTLAIIVLPFIGMILYFLVGRNGQDKAAI